MDIFDIFSVHWRKSWEKFRKKSVFFPKFSQNEYFLHYILKSRSVWEIVLSKIIIFKNKDPFSPRNLWDWCLKHPFFLLFCHSSTTTFWCFGSRVYIGVPPGSISFVLCVNSLIMRTLMYLQVRCYLLLFFFCMLH